MNIILISSSIIMGVSFLFMNHPLSFGMNLLIQTILIAMMTGLLSYNFLFSYIIILIMIGGMLILFIYMTSIASNEKFKFSYKLFILISLLCLIMISLFIMDLFFFNLNMMNNLYNQNMTQLYKLSMNKFLMWPMNMIFYMMIIYLLITLIMVIILLTWIGARPVEDPYIIVGQILTIMYFLYFFINPLIAKIQDKILFK